MQFEKVHPHSPCIHSPFLLLFTTKPYKLAPTYVHAQKYTLHGVLCVQRWQPHTSATCQKWPLKWCELFTLAFTFHQDMHYKQPGKSDSEVKWRKEKTQQLPAWTASALTVWTLHFASYYILNFQLRQKALKHLWQSRVEIEHYSVAYFDRVTMIEVW